MILDLPIELPENYEFALNVRGEGPANNLELKLVDRGRAERLVGEPPRVRVAGAGDAAESIGGGTFSSPGDPAAASR